MNHENARKVAELMHEMKPEGWRTYEDAYGKLSDIEESIGTIGWHLEDDDGMPVGWTLFREMKNHLTLELGCSGFNDHGEFKPEHKLKELFDTAVEYAGSKGYATLRTGMSSVDFNIDDIVPDDISETIRTLQTDRIDYHWLLNYGFRVIGIHPNAYGNNIHLILSTKAL